MKEIIGKTINKIFTNDDQSVLVFETSEGDVIYQTEGDCCSETWFADVTGVDALIGGTVQNAEDIEMETVVDGRTRQEEDEFYGVKIVTDKGHSSIVYRNSSNGYYGGNINHVQIPRPELLVPITEDWSA